MSATGLYDCTNEACARRLELVEGSLRLLAHGQKPPKCETCGQRMRLVRVRYPMTDQAKAALKERAAVKRNGEEG